MPSAWPGSLTGRPEPARTFPPPKYPRRAAEREVSGWVELEFMVMEDGTTSNVEISRSEPDKVFDRAAIDAVERWEFEPVVYRGQTIAKRVATRVVFRLE